MQPEPVKGSAVNEAEEIKSDERDNDELARLSKQNEEHVKEVGKEYAGVTGS